MRWCMKVRVRNLRFEALRFLNFLRLTFYRVTIDGACTSGRSGAPVMLSTQSDKSGLVAVYMPQGSRVVDVTAGIVTRVAQAVGGGVGRTASSWRCARAGDWPSDPLKAVCGAVVR